MRRRVKIIVAAALLALVATVAGATAKSAALDPGITKNSILIGGTFPESGEASMYGVIPKAETAYFNWFDDHSSINGRKVHFIYYDDQYDPSQTVPLTRKLVEQDHVFAIFNSLGTAPNLAIRPYLNQRHVPHVLLASGDSYWGTDYKKYPWTIGYQPSYIGEGRIYGLYIKTHMKNAKIGILKQNDAYGDNYLGGLRAGLKGGTAKIVDIEPFDVTDPTVAPQMAKLKQSGADVFVDFATPKASIQALVIKGRTAWTAQNVINSVSASPAFMKIVKTAAGAGAVDGSITDVYPVDATDPAQANNPGVKQFKAIMTKYYPGGDQGDALNIYGFGVAWTMIEALKHSGKTPTRKGLMKALTHMNAKNPFLLKGIVIKTTPTEHFLIDQVQLARWQGDYWHRFGKLYSKAR